MFYFTLHIGILLCIIIIIHSLEYWKKGVEDKYKKSNTYTRIKRNIIINDLQQLQRLVL